MSSRGLLRLGMATTSGFQNLGILRWRKQDDRNLRNQDFSALTSWSISSEQIRSGLGALPGFGRCNAEMNSTFKNSSEML